MDLDPPALPDFSEANTLEEKLDIPSQSAYGRTGGMAGIPKKKSSLLISKLRSLFQDSQQASIAPELRRQVKPQISTPTEPPISPPLSPRTGPEATQRSTESQNEHTVLVHESKLEVAPQRSVSITPSNSSNDNSARFISKSRQVVQNHVPESSTNLALDVFEPQHVPEIPPHSSSSSHSGAFEPYARVHERVGLDMEASNVCVNRVSTPSLPLDDLEFNRLDVNLADYLIALCSDPRIERSDALHRFLNPRRPETFTGSSPMDQGSHTSRSETIDKPSCNQSTLGEEGCVNPEIKAGEDSAESKTGQDSSNRSQTARQFEGKKVSHARTSPGPFPGEENALKQTKSLEDAVTTAIGSGLDTVPHPGDPVNSGTRLDQGGEGYDGPSSYGRERSSPQTCPSKPRKVTINDFDLIRTLGTGCAGKVSYPAFVGNVLSNTDIHSQVVLARHKKSRKVIALKAMAKKQVIARSELRHALVCV